MNVNIFRLMTTIIALLLVAASIACAASKPRVTRADGIFMDSGVSFRIQWESSEPVARVHISMGVERKSIDVDFRDNRRNPNGYSGEATALVPVPGGAISAFTVQIEDEFRIKSDVLNGVISGNRSAFPPGMQPDDGWGQQNLTRPGGTPPGGMQQGGFPPPMAPGMMPPPMMPPPMMPPPQPGMMPPPQPGMMPPPQPGMMPPPQPGMMPPPQPGMMPPPQPGMPMDPGMMQPGMMPQQQPGMMPPPQPGMPMDPGMMPPPPPPPPPMQ